MSALLDYRYWLNPNPVPLGPSLVGSVFVFFAWFVVAAVALIIGAGVLKKRNVMLATAFRRFSALFAVTGLSGLLLLFFAYEQIPVFGMRLWLLPLAAYFFVKLSRIVLYVARDYPRERERAIERERLERYLPQRR